MLGPAAESGKYAGPCELRRRNTHSAAADSSYSNLPGARLAHRLHDAQASDARDLAHHGNLARALHEAHRVEDRIEIADLRAGRQRAQRAMNAASRDGRPSHGSVAVATACATASPVEPPPQDLRAKRRCRSAGPAGRRGRPLATSASRGTTRVDASERGRLLAGPQVRPVVALAPRGAWRNSVDCFVRPSIDERPRAAPRRR